MIVDPLKKNWYVFYTCPRAEKIVNKKLSALGYELFLPLKKEFKIWKNRQRKLIETPLFPSYIFVNTFQREIYSINKVHGICTCVTMAGAPVIISDNDITSLKTMQDMDVITIKNDGLLIGDRIRVIDGPLCGYEGIYIKMKGQNKFGININCANLIAIVDLDASKIQKL